MPTVMGGWLAGCDRRRRDSSTTSCCSSLLSLWHPPFSPAVRGNRKQEVRFLAPAETHPILILPLSCCCHRRCLWSHQRHRPRCTIIAFRLAWLICLGFTMERLCEPDGSTVTCFSFGTQKHWINNDVVALRQLLRRTNRYQPDQLACCSRHHFKVFVISGSVFAILHLYLLRFVGVRVFCLYYFYVR
jgi:hypothetical protein